MVATLDERVADLELALAELRRGVERQENKPARDVIERRARATEDKKDPAAEEKSR